MNQEKSTLKRNFSKEEVQESYSKVAWFYDQWGKLTESRASQRVTQLANIQDGEHVLEVAVGTGVVFAEIVKRNPNGQNEGIHLSPSMFKRAEERLKNYNTSSFHLQIGSVDSNEIVNHYRTGSLQNRESNYETGRRRRT